MRTILALCAVVAMLAAACEASFAEEGRKAELLPLGKREFEAALRQVKSMREDKEQWRAEWRRYIGFGPIGFPIPVCGFAGGLCGAVNEDGTVAVEGQYDWVDNFHDERALVRSNGLYGYVDTTGRVIAKPQYPIAAPFYRGYAQVDVDGKSGMIDREGHLVIAAKFAYIRPFAQNAVWVNDDRKVDPFDPKGDDRFATPWYTAMVFGPPNSRRIWGNERIGLLALDGTWIRDYNLGAVLPFDHRDASLAWAKYQDKWGVIRPDGSWVVAPRFDDVITTTDDLAPVKLNGKWGLINRAGGWHIPPRFDMAVFFEGGQKLAAARSDKLYGLIDRTGAWVMPPSYEFLIREMRPTFERTWQARTGERFTFLSENGDVSVAFDAELTQAPHKCHDGFFYSSDSRGFIVFSPEGKRLSPETGEVQDGCGSPRRVKSGYYYGTVDKSMRWILKPEYDSIGSRAEGRSIVEKDGKAGIIADDGTWVVEPALEKIKGSPNELMTARQNGKYGFMRPDGTWLLGPSFDKAQRLSGWSRDRSRYLTERDHLSGLLQMPEGIWILPQEPRRLCSREGLVLAIENGIRSFHDPRTGERLGIFPYDLVRMRLKDGLVAVQTGGKWGFADYSGKLVIPAEYDAAQEFERGISWVRKGEEQCAIDRLGKRIAHLSCLPAGPPKEPVVSECLIED